MRRRRGEAEVIEEAAKRFPKEGRGRDLTEIFGSTQRHQQEQGVGPLSEDEAMKLAVGKEHAWRREHKAGDGRR
jgi:hypothetical protein